MKKREIYTINNNHGIIIIINEKQYLYMSSFIRSVRSESYSLTETDINMLFSSLKRYISYMPLKKLSRLTVEDYKYIGMIDEKLFLSVFPESKYQKCETSNIIIHNANYLELQRLRNFLEENGILNATDENLENAWIKFSNEKIFTNWADMDGYNLKRFLQCSHRYL